jgi:hypothetical protein
MLLASFFLFIRSRAVVPVSRFGCFPDRPELSGTGLIG